MTVPDPTDRGLRLSPDAALAALRAGHHRFRTGDASPPPPSGSGPLAAVFACSDPQPAPETLFGGSDVFTVRTAGLTIGPIVLASLEYAVIHLRLPLVVVLGHETCRLHRGGGDARVRETMTALRQRSTLLDAAARSGQCAIHGMAWHDARLVLSPVGRSAGPPTRRTTRLRTASRRVGRCTTGGPGATAP